MRCRKTAVPSQFTPLTVELRLADKSCCDYTDQPTNSASAIFVWTTYFLCGSKIYSVRRTADRQRGYSSFLLNVSYLYNNMLSMKTYSLDLRERVVKAYDQKFGAQAKIAELFGVSVPWIKKLLRRRRETGSLAPKPHGGGQQPAFEGENLENLKKLVEQNPDATLQELGELSGVKCGIVAVWRTLKKLGCHRKKVVIRCRTGQAGRQGEA
jgi:transposase